MNAAIAEDGLLATLEYRPFSPLAFQFGAGAILDGTAMTANGAYRMSSGWIYSLAVSYRLMDGQGYRPFVMLAANLSVSSTRTSSMSGPSNADGTTLLAADTGVVVSVGKTLWHTLSPYVMARVFGGPVFWRESGRDMIGGDAYHFQLGGGLVVALFGRVDAFVEAAPLGEQRYSAGAGVSF